MYRVSWWREKNYPLPLGINSGCVWTIKLTSVSERSTFNDIFNYVWWIYVAVDSRASRTKWGYMFWIKKWDKTGTWSQVVKKGASSDAHQMLCDLILAMQYREVCLICIGLFLINMLMLTRPTPTPSSHFLG